MVVTLLTTSMFELDHELAVALASVMEGAARSTVQKVTQVQPSHGLVAWLAVIDGCTPKSSNDPAIAQQPKLATHKDAKELKEKLTPWSLKVAEYDHKFKVIDEAQNTIVAREMMPKDIKRELMTGLMKLDEIMEKLEIMFFGMIADDGPAPMDLGKSRYARCENDAERPGREQRHVVRRCVRDRLERVQSQQGSSQERTKRSRNVVSWKRS